MKRERLFVLVMVIATVAVATPQSNSQMASGNVAANQEWAALQQSLDKMHAAMMSAKPSSNTDVDFVRLMLPHHVGAIEMAKAQLLYGTDPQMRRLAQEIITDQQSEIELMQLWLRQHTPNSSAPKSTSDADKAKD
jgi:uncharacterized protein (DUF305 family)